MRRLCVPLCLGSALLAQQELKIPRPMVVESILKPMAPDDCAPARPQAHQPAPPAEAAFPNSVGGDAAVARHAVAGGAFEITAPVYDEPQPGQVWVLAPQWKAGFTAAGATFVPFFGSDAPRNHAADFQVAAARVGGVPLPTEATQVVRHGDRVAIQRAGFVEQYLVSPRGIEQQFVFADLPVRGSLSVEIAVGGGYQVTAEGRELRFQGELGSFRYGAPMAFDAAGDSVPMEAQYQAGVLHLQVPAAFVQRAQLPLVIDPLIGNVVTLANSAVRIAATDLAYDSSLEQYVACYERVFSQTDSDVYALRLDANLQPVGTSFTVDNTSASWRRCRIANLNAYDKFLVVAESEVVGNLIAIAGRVYHAGNHTVSSQFDIERGTRSCGKPDVGGDPSLTTPTYWTVVFERQWTSSDGDIMMRQVTEGGVLRGSGMTAIDASTAAHEAPVISRSNGTGTFAQQVWLVCYLQDSGGGQFRVQLRGVAWDGQLLGSVASQQWEYSGPRRFVAVSSPTSVGHGQVFATVFGCQDLSTGRMRLGMRALDSQGVSASNWLALTDGSVDCSEPSVETDGYRFVVSYAQQVGATGRTVVAKTFDLRYVVGSGVYPFALRDTAQFGSSAADQIGLALCSRYTGGLGGTAIRDTEYALLWGQNGGGSSDTLATTRYLGHATQGGLATRATGCGLGAVQATTSSYFGVLGSQNTFTLPNANGLVGWVVGLPVSQPIAGCAGCTQGSSAFVTLLGAQTQFNVPYTPTYVGMTFALQAFAFGPGSCLGSLAFSDTSDLTIR
jgi:hypothetical protein